MRVPVRNQSKAVVEVVAKETLRRAGRDGTRVQEQQEGAAAGRSSSRKEQQQEQEQDHQQRQQEEQDEL
jgi:hypothetical protein